MRSINPITVRDLTSYLHGSIPVKYTSERGLRLGGTPPPASAGRASAIRGGKVVNREKIPLFLLFFDCHLRSVASAGVANPGIEPPTGENRSKPLW
jgi:hypothetical protein